MKRLKNFMNECFPENMLIMSYVWAFMNMIFTEGILQLINLYWVFLGLYFFMTYKFREVKLKYLEEKCTTK